MSVARRCLRKNILRDCEVLEYRRSENCTWFGSVNEFFTCFSHDFFPDISEIGFGGLGVACWPLAPKFAGSNPAEAVGFLGRKNPQHAFLRRGSRSHVVDLRHVKDP